MPGAHGACHAPTAGILGTPGEGVEDHPGSPSLRTCGAEFVAGLCWLLLHDVPEAFLVFCVLGLFLTTCPIYVAVAGLQRADHFAVQGVLGGEVLQDG